MKKIFTLLVTVCMVTAVSAQLNENAEGYTKNRDVSFEDKYYRQENTHIKYRHSNFYKREMEIKIAEINKEYDCEMREARNNCFMNCYRKQYVLSMLEDRRREEIAGIYTRYNRGSYFGYN